MCSIFLSALNRVLEFRFEMIYDGLVDLRQFEIAQRHREASDRSQGMRWMRQERPDVHRKTTTKSWKSLEFVTRSSLV